MSAATSNLDVAKTAFRSIDICGIDMEQSTAQAFVQLLGSAAFVEEGILSGSELAAYINFDMVGRMRDNRLVVQAVGSSPRWPRLLEQANMVVGFDLKVQEDPCLHDYTYALDAVKVDQPLEVVYLRDGKERTTTMTPRARN